MLVLGSWSGEDLTRRLVKRPVLDLTGFTAVVHFFAATVMLQSRVLTALA